MIDKTLQHAAPFVLIMLPLVSQVPRPSISATTTAQRRSRPSWTISLLPTPGFAGSSPSAQVTKAGASRALKISDSVTVDETDEGDVVFFALPHSREWISVEMALYLAGKLLSRYAADAALRADIDELEIWVVPVVNPDGFAHTWTPSGYRYWRKNRRNNADGTFGVDLNRIWGFEWGRNDGSSPDTFSDTYRGPAAWSEPEIFALRNLADGLGNLKTLVTYHSFS